MQEKKKIDLWFTEMQSDDISLSFRAADVPFHAKSLYQDIDIIDNPQYGRMLVHDGLVMLAQGNQFVYSEMISHVPLFTHPHPERVLIIGGGDGGTLCEVLKHPEVREVDMVEIDAMVVETAKKYFPDIAREFSNPKVHLKFEDGARFVRKARNRYDVAIVDSTDPIGFAAVLFQGQFFQDLRECLTKDGLLSAQCESPFFHESTIRETVSNLKELFPTVRLYLAYIPVYPSGMWAFALASKEFDPEEDFQHKRYDRLQLGLRYYNDRVHRGAFYLPTFVRKMEE